MKANAFIGRKTRTNTTTTLLGDFSSTSSISGVYINILDTDSVSGPCWKGNTSTMNHSVKLTGAPIPRRSDVNIIEDMADIAQAVKGSGLPDVFFTDQCCVWVQLQALSTYMDLTPRQITILSVILEHNGYASLKDMAGYIGCPVCRLHSMHWDFELLRHIEYLKDGEQLYEYIIEPDLIAGWAGNRLYRAFQDPQEAISNHMLGRIGYEVTLFGSFIKNKEKLSNTIDHYLETYSGCQLLAYIQSLAATSPSPELGSLILLMILAKNFKSIFYENRVCESEVMWFIRKVMPDSTDSQIQGVIDYLVGVGIMVKGTPDTYSISDGIINEVALLIGDDVSTMSPL